MLRGIKLPKSGIFSMKNASFVLSEKARLKAAFRLYGIKARFMNYFKKRREENKNFV